MTGTAYATSAEMAELLGAFPGFAANRDAMLRVIRNHRRAAYSQTRRLRRRSRSPPVALDVGQLPRRRSRRGAPRRPGTRRLRWASSTASATPRSRSSRPTGTIGLVMDCDTTGIEPDFALVKFKKLAGGGYFKIINQTVPLALATPRLRRGERSTRIVAHAVGHGTLQGAPAINHETLAARGFDAATLERVEKALPTAFDIRFAFSRYTLGDDFCREMLGLDDSDARRSAARPAGAPRLLTQRHRRGEHLSPAGR